MSSVAVGDNIYTFGGKESGVVTNKTEYYNTSNEIWYRKAPMPVDDISIQPFYMIIKFIFVVVMMKMV